MTNPTNPDLPTSKLGEVVDALSEFIAAESELAAAELKPAAKHAGIGSGMFAGAGTFALHALWMLIIAFALAIGWILDAFTALSTWGAFTIGFIIAAVISLLIAFVLVKIGQAQMKKVKKPEATIAEAKATLQAIVASLGRIKGEPQGAEVIRPDDDAWRRPTPLQTDNAWRRPTQLGRDDLTG